MKKIIFILIIILVSGNLNADNFDLGIRYLKLAQTYREGRDFDNAEKYLDKGERLIKRQNDWSGRYWQAAAKEYRGHLYRDMASNGAGNADFLNEKSQELFGDALISYKKLISMEGGSQDAITLLIDNIRNLTFMVMDERGFVSGSDILNYENLRLRALPADIPSDVKNISLANNRFRDFPAGLTIYKNLEYLNLSNNRLRDLSPAIGDLANLHWLDLSGNRLREIPVGLGNLQQLEELNLEDNRIRDIPADLTRLKNLKILNLKNNDIPFNQLSNLIRELPNTNILFDEYEIDD